MPNPLRCVAIHEIAAANSPSALAIAIRASSAGRVAPLSSTGVTCSDAPRALISPLRIERSTGSATTRWRGWREDALHYGQVDGQQDDNHQRRRHHGRHESRLAIQPLRILRGAVLLHRDGEINGHDQRDRRKGENELQSIPHAEPVSY